MRLLRRYIVRRVAALTYGNGEVLTINRNEICTVTACIVKIRRFTYGIQDHSIAYDEQEYTKPWSLYNVAELLYYFHSRFMTIHIGHIQKRIHISICYSDLYIRCDDEDAVDEIEDK